MHSPPRWNCFETSRSIHAALSEPRGDKCRVVTISSGPVCTFPDEAEPASLSSDTVNQPPFCGRFGALFFFSFFFSEALSVQ